jgi:dolichyl-diphosphooligosaccharide--protein glycosyltransferase
MPPKTQKTPTKVPLPPAQSSVSDTTYLDASEPLASSTTPHDEPITKPAAARKLAYPLPQHISPATINNTESLLRFVILGLISAAAIGSRLFAVIRFESVIHEL